MSTPKHTMNVNKDRTGPYEELPINNQPTEKPEIDPRGFLQVHSVFATIQGEGPYSGKTAIFVRFAGCNLQCPLCDTEYTANRRKVRPDRLALEVQHMATNNTLIVITGGEPFRQNLTPFVKMMLVAGYEVQIETNGTLALQSFPYSQVCICVAPKTGNVHPQIRSAASYWKYVLDADNIDEKDGLPTSVLGMNVKPARPWLTQPDPSSRWVGPEVWLQPCDMQDVALNTLNTQAMVASCMAFGYRASVQLHKLLGLA